MRSRGQNRSFVRCGGWLRIVIRDSSEGGNRPGWNLPVTRTLLVAEGGSLTERSDDPQPLEVLVESLSQKVTSLEARLQATENVQSQFVAPVTGTYAFYVNLLSDHDVNTWINFCIVKDGLCVALTQLHDAASMSVVLELQAADTVYAIKRDGPGGTIYGINHSTFSGLLVKPHQ
ncbi:hypothetical protein BaRGS_00021466 [Batillaria attramentaria]|uniref:C1q domain-containing protein n=1 Tax=Batillaria attramentaria TaxID=370345 RepID=A0ABD0KJ64_9CAEN